MKAGLQIPAVSPEAKGSRSGSLHSAGAGSRHHPRTGPELAGIRPITLTQPGKICFGDGVSLTLAEELSSRDLRRPFIVIDPAVRKAGEHLIRQIKDAGMEASIWDEIEGEPAVSIFNQCLDCARDFSPDSVIGLGGGSAMDVAKLVAALVDGRQSIREVFGINALRGRKLFLVCVPTTSGTGSEVSPNAILLEESSQLKKGVISPHLVPDVALVDPLLTHSVPAAVTAATGIDALTHCIEAYANNFAHPMVDLHALEGIRLISGALLRAVADGSDAAARACIALGSLYGGLCLGPVNTAAVHALAYPLGSRFHIAHGVSNAVLLPHVMRYNIPSACERYCEIARAMGVGADASAEQAAELGIRRIEEIMAECPIPRSISELGVPIEALPDLARDAMTVTRLLKNNPRALSQEDALEVYRAAW